GDHEPAGFRDGVMPFGSGGGCPLQPEVKTEWPTYTDLLLRKAIDLPEGTTNVQVSITIDNGFAAFWNGTQINHPTPPEQLFTNNGNCPSRDQFVLSVPNGLLRSGQNLLVLRARDRGVESFIDVKVTAS